MTVPPLARWWLSRVLTEGDRAFFLGDLEEEFEKRNQNGGRRNARLWYWQQALHSTAPLLKQRLRARKPHTPKTSGDPMWRDLLGDFKYTLRLSRRSPLASATVILTMVLGIGVTTAVFSVVNSVLLKPLPFAGAERTVQLSLTLRDGRAIPVMSAPLLEDYRRDAKTFASFAAATSSNFTLTQGDTPVELKAALVDSGYASVFGVRPFAGRYFTDNEFQFGGPKVVLLSYAYWKRQYSGDRSIVGKSISLDNEPRTVIGVLPAMQYSYPLTDIDVMAPLVIEAGSGQANRTSFWLSAVGTIKTGATIEQARGDIAAINEHNRAAHPESGPTAFKIQLTPLRDTIVGDVRQMLALLSASVAAVLLIVCVNIANLLLGRSQARAREFVVRAALGASRGRLGRQLLSESVMLSSVGGLLGIVLAPLMTRGLIALYPGELPRVEEIGTDIRVLAFAVVITMLAGVLAGLPMARRAIGMNLSRDLRNSTRLAGGVAQQWWGGALIVSQVAMSVTLLFAGSLLLRTFSTLSSTNPGFQPNQVTSFYLFPSSAKYPKGAPVSNFYDAVTESLSHIPGVQSVATGGTIPLDDSHTSTNPFVDKRRGNQPGKNPSVRTADVSETFFATLGMPVLAGRAFTASDNNSAPKVMVINEALAQSVYPGENPVGRTVEWNGSDWQIVGVVGDVHSAELWEAPRPTFYAPTRQSPERGRFVIVKAAIPLSQLLSQSRAALGKIDPTVALTSVATMNDLLATAVAPQRFRAALVGGLGVLALVLSTLGIYGVVASAVGRQTREIGIRMALGEAANRVQQRVVLSSLKTAALGAVIGMVGALAAGRWIADLLVGASPKDPKALLAVGVLLLVVATVAAYVPARRASRVDPVIALRSD